MPYHNSATRSNLPCATPPAISDVDISHRSDAVCWPVNARNGDVLVEGAWVVVRRDERHGNTAVESRRRRPGLESSRTLTGRFIRSQTEVHCACVGLMTTAHHNDLEQHTNDGGSVDVCMQADGCLSQKPFRRPACSSHMVTAACSRLNIRRTISHVHQ